MYIVGAGGFAREVVDILDACEQRFEGFIVTKEYAQENYRLMGKPVFIGLDYAKSSFAQALVVAIGDPSGRKAIVEEASSFHFPKLIHPSVTHGREVRIGSGSILCAGVRLTCDINIDRFVIINLNCTVGHDSKIGDFTTLSPGVHVSGNVEIGERVFIGTGAVIGPNVTIKDRAIIGAGAVVLKDVPADTFVAGVPARIISERIK